MHCIVAKYFILQYHVEHCYMVGRYSSVGIATRYRLDVPGIEPRWGRDFSQPSRPALGPIQPPIQWVPGLFPEGKAVGCVVLNTHPPSSARVKERVELYLYSPSGPSWPVLGRTLHFYLKLLRVSIPYGSSSGNHIKVTLNKPELATFATVKTFVIFQVEVTVC
jgi:hypothetical protein